MLGSGLHDDTSGGRGAWGASVSLPWRLAYDAHGRNGEADARESGRK